MNIFIFLPVCKAYIFNKSGELHILSFHSNELKQMLFLSMLDAFAEYIAGNIRVCISLEIRRQMYSNIIKK